MTPTFSGEVQLRRWSESSTQGVQVTFALADADDLEPLKIKSGKRFMAVLVEIGDDETPVQYPPGAVVPCDKNLKPTFGPLVLWLVVRCREPEFWAFLGNEFKLGTLTPTSEPDCAERVKSLLMIDSRKEIDANPELEKLCNDLIRHPYQRWLVRRSG